MIEGELTSVGDGYVLTARLADARSKETLASLRETAADANGIIPAIDRLSGGMREKIGDSYTNMRADEPLEYVTTGSLEALEKNSRALELFAAGTDHELAVDLLEEAVAIDSGFAMACASLVWRRWGSRREIEAFENRLPAPGSSDRARRLWRKRSTISDVEDDPRKAISCSSAWWTRIPTTPGPEQPGRVVRGDRRVGGSRVLGGEVGSRRFDREVAHQRRVHSDPAGQVRRGRGYP